ncbi:MAG: hypothetical protein GX842_02365 [Spirochaetales bacterium]|nr:hypothetical protein [Spirochaetales bacterium]
MRTLAIASLPNLTLEERLYLQSSPVETSTLVGRCNRGELESLLRWCEKEGNRWVSYGDECYPVQLRNIKEAPFLLTYRGNLTMEGMGLSLVGGRFPTKATISAASTIATQCNLLGHTVVSGFEGGIPIVVHRTAFKSWAVLSFGLEQITLPRLANLIVDRGGALISEWHPHSSPARRRYLYTSRLIGALSPLTLLFGARRGSSATYCADYALDYGREVAVTTQGQEESGSKALVEAGAPLVATFEQIMEVSGINYGRL